MTRPQLPGRIEALRLVLRTGTDNAPANLLHLAGMGKKKRPMPSGASLPQGITLASGFAHLSPAERAEFPF